MPIRCSTWPVLVFAAAATALVVAIQKYAGGDGLGDFSSFLTKWGNSGTTTATAAVSSSSSGNKVAVVGTNNNGRQQQRPPLSELVREERIVGNVQWLLDFAIIGRKWSCLCVG